MTRNLVGESESWNTLMKEGIDEFEHKSNTQTKELIYGKGQKGLSLYKHTQKMQMAQEGKSERASQQEIDR